MGIPKARRLLTSKNTSEESLRFYERERERERKRRTDEALALIELDLNSEFEPVVARLRSRIEQQSTRLLDELESSALAGIDPYSRQPVKHPLGTKLTKIPKVPGKGAVIFGVVEAVTRNTKLTIKANSPRKKINMPDVGTFIIRHLNADGTPATTFDTSFSKWTPTDQDQVSLKEI